MAERRIPFTGMTRKLDEIDAGILTLLQQNARMMYKDMAEHLGVSIPTVKTHMDNLVDIGIIKKFTAVVDADKLAGKIRAILTVGSRAADIHELSSKLSEMDEVREVYQTSGSFDIIAKVEVDDIAGLETLTTTKLASIPEIQQAKSSIIVKTVKEEYGVSVAPEAIIEFRCTFCGLPITGKPIVEWIGESRYYFGHDACLEAFKEGGEKRYWEK